MSHLYTQNMCFITHVHICHRCVSHTYLHPYATCTEMCTPTHRLIHTSPTPNTHAACTHIQQGKLHTTRSGRRSAAHRQCRNCETHQPGVRSEPGSQGSPAHHRNVSRRKLRQDTRACQASAVMHFTTSHNNFCTFLYVNDYFMKYF